MKPMNWDQSALCKNLLYLFKSTNPTVNKVPVHSNMFIFAEAFHLTCECKCGTF